jgi:hypothetical protein
MAVTPVGYSSKPEGSSVTKGPHIEAGWAENAKAAELHVYSKL